MIPRAQTWSNYKEYNTVKFLIGIDPQGVISFISKAWGGRVSDVYLTENSGLLNNLLQGDLVLDRSTTIQDSVRRYVCTVLKLNYPIHKGEKQLSQCQRDTSLL